MRSEPSALIDLPAGSVAPTARPADRAGSAARAEPPGQPQPLIDTETLVRQQGSLLGYVADALDEPSFRGAATALVSRLAGSLQCERVSLGVFEGEQIDVVALSNTVDFQPSAGLLRDIRSAMQDAASQRCTVQHPSTDDASGIDTAHAALARLHGSRYVISVPLVVREAVFGVLTLEGGSEPLGSHDVAMVERLGLIVSPILKLKHDVEIPVPRRLVSATAALAQKVLGPSYLVVKLMVLVLAVAAVFAASVDGQRRIVADANLEARDVHAVVAPARGYISKVHRRAGDAVEAGAPLAELDRRDLVVELEKWRTELSKNVEEQHAALASRDRRRSRVLKLQEQQIEAQIRLVENLMERGNLVSPVAGIVTSADPNFSYGAPVERGQLLFEIAPLTSYRLVLSVDEGDIADVAPGQGGRMVLSGRPFEPLQFTVRDVVPLAESGGGQNRFRVEADLEEAPEWLRPGMSGIAKISVGEERLAWLWTHRMLEAVQLTLWRWGWS